MTMSVMWVIGRLTDDRSGMVDIRCTMIVLLWLFEVRVESHWGDVLH
jgi:hypothetical protein